MWPPRHSPIDPGYHDRPRPPNRAFVPGQRIQKAVNGMTQTRGIRHLALRVKNLRRSQNFYEGLFGMKVVWQPDGDNVYLSSGSDNLALHQIAAAEQHEYDSARGQFLDHFGFLMDSQESVDRLFQSVERHVGRYGGAVVKVPKRHRDDSYSFYLADPDGNVIQVLYEPTISE